MTPYPTYKPSGLPWLGDIPAYWDVLPIKHFVKINQTTMPETTPANYELAYLDIGNVNESGIIGEPQKFLFADAPSRARRVIQSGDTIISTVRTYLKAIAHIDSCPSNWVASTGFAVLTPDSNTLPKYVSYLVHAQTFIDEVTATSKGVSYPAITSIELGSLKCAVTNSPDEQAAIVAFLDRKGAEIDRFLSAKLRLITLLREQKAALITQAVTHGLNPDTPMKASGTMFLESVPKHWEVKRGKYYFYEVDERSEKGTEELLSVSHITGVTPRSEKNVTMFVAESYEGSKTCQPGDIVINTMWAWMGALGISTLSGIVSSSYGIYNHWC